MSDFLETFRSIFLRPYGDFTRLSTILVDLLQMKAGVPGDITLKQRPREGTPIDKSSEPANQAKLQLENPVLAYRYGQLLGAATLSLGSDSPHFADPLKIDVNLSSSKISFSDIPLFIQSQGPSHEFTAQGEILPKVRLRGEARLSIFTADWVLRVQYDRARLSSGIEKAIAYGGQQGTLGNLVEELRYPGFDLSAVVRASLPVLGKVPVSRLSFSAPTTRPLRNPLPGAAFPMPYRYRARGVTPMPPGTLSDNWSIGFWGHTQADFNAIRGSSFIAAIRPGIEADGASLWEKFPIYGYLEYYRIHKVSDGLELGFRLTLSPSSLDLIRLTGSSKQDEDVLMKYRDYTNELEDKVRLRTMIKFEVLGRHDWFGGG